MSVISPTSGRTSQGCGNACAESWGSDVKIYKRAYFDEGFRFCSICEISIQIDENRCRCCKQQMRLKPREKRNKNDRRIQM